MIISVIAHVDLWVSQLQDDDVWLVIISEAEAQTKA